MCVCRYTHNIRNVCVYVNTIRIHPYILCMLSYDMCTSVSAAYCFQLMFTALVWSPCPLALRLASFFSRAWSFPSCHCSIHNALNQSPAAEHRDPFQPFVFTNNAAMSNISLYFDLYAHVISFMKQSPSSRLSGSKGRYILCFYYILLNYPSKKMHPFLLLPAVHGHA